MPILVKLLQEAVATGASVGFLMPLSNADAEAYWQSVAEAVASGQRYLLAAWSDSTELLGTVQLDLATKPNARHRAEVQKLLVFQAHRRKGIGAELMQEIEHLAQEQGRSLLVLDTLKEGGAESLYERLGYQRAGEIPNFAITTDGKGFEATVLYYKILG
jgi:acetyltransferase